MKAVVTAAVCPLTTAPRPDCALADEALFGMVVEVLEETSGRYWKVRTHYRCEGYAPADCLLADTNGVAAWEGLSKRVVLHKNSCDVLCAPTFQSRPRITLPLGAVVAAAEPPETEAESGKPTDWQKVLLPGGGEGYVRASWLGTHYARPVDLPERELRQRLADTAMLYQRTQYRWGGKTPWGIDCSGLASMAYLLNGIIIYRDARMEPGFDLVEIPQEEIDVGDLLYFPGHVAMYLGRGSYLHATGRAGSDGVDFNSLEPGHPLYREDLAGKVTGVGSYRGFHL